MVDRLALEVEVLEIECAVAMLAAGIPPSARRPPLPHEVIAPVDFAVIKDRLDQAASDLGAELLRARHELLLLLLAWLLLGYPTPSIVMQRIASLSTAGKMPTGARQIVQRVQQRVQARLQQVADGALGDTHREGTSLGGSPGRVDVAAIKAVITAQAAKLAVAPWVAAIMALRGALPRTPAAPRSDGADFARKLIDAAEAASVAGLLNEGRQGAHAAQGIGRTEGFKVLQFPEDVHVVAYASELLDDRTCQECESIDGYGYETLDDAFVDYPAGQYVSCQGGANCRGMLVILDSGALGQAA